ncbi:MAG: NnrS family protein [Alphaproteobacteria bacterium]|nr:NnrS family protein [Alphaproteobacteria bacterium]
MGIFALPIFSQVFRLFFLLACFYAIIFVTAWLLLQNQQVIFSLPFTLNQWHSHELIYGFAVAILTAVMTMPITGWYGGFAVKGIAVFGLASLWIAGRIVLFLDMPFFAIALIELSYLTLLLLLGFLMTLRHITERNVGYLLLVALFLISQILFYWEIHDGYSEYASRFGIANMVYMMLLVSGRVMAESSKQILGNTNIRAQETNWFDGFVILATLAGLCCWIYNPYMAWLGYGLLVITLFNLIRLWRWAIAFEKAHYHHLLSVLHFAYYGIVLGLVSAAFANFRNDVALDLAVIHIWGLSFGIFSVAMMIRAGQTVMNLRYDLPISLKIGYLMFILSAIASLCYGIANSQAVLAFYIAIAGWLLGFAILLFIFTPAFCKKQ